MKIWGIWSHFLKETFVKIAQLGWDRKKIHHSSFKKTYGKFTKWMKIQRSWHHFPRESIQSCYVMDEIWKACLLQFLKENMCGNYTMHSKVWKTLQNFFKEVAFDGRKFGEVGPTSFRKTFQRWIVSTFVRQWGIAQKSIVQWLWIQLCHFHPPLNFFKLSKYAQFSSIVKNSKISKAFYIRWHLKKNIVEKNE
jgi:hypothetical protein